MLYILDVLSLVLETLISTEEPQHNTAFKIYCFCKDASWRWSVATRSTETTFARYVKENEQVAGKQYC